MTEQLVMDLKQAAARRDVGMLRAQEKADRVCPGWSMTAFDFVRGYVKRVSEFLAEDLKADSLGVVPEPTDGRAWGAVIQRAVREGLIEKIGYAPAKTSNCSPKPLWKSLAPTANSETQPHVV